MKALNDRHSTLQNHLEANGLAEHVVQAIKQGLCKYNLLCDNHHYWDFMLP